MEGVILMKRINQFLAKNYTKVRKFKMLLLFTFIILSYLYKFHYDLILPIIAMLFLIELKKCR